MKISCGYMYLRKIILPVCDFFLTSYTNCVIEKSHGQERAVYQSY
jgi:hypothetical protein